jgi:hypothetical protein
MTADNVTVLRCHDNVRLAKLITRKADGELEVKGFDDARTFAWRQVTVSGLDDIQLLLEQLRGDPKSCVIRGEPREGVGARAIVNRRQHLGPDGSEPHWKHHPTGRRWLAFDLDKVAQDAFSEGVPTEEQVRAIVYQVRAEVLPQAFTRAACVYKLSSSAGLYGWGKVSMHLWFWLDRPVHDLSLREFFKAGGFDISFSKCVQPHYTADPVFEGMTDPLAGVRLGRLPGRPVVEVPPELVDGDTWRQRDVERREAAKRDIEKRAKAAMADIAPSRAATRAYALKALQGACSDVLAAAEGTRHDQLIRSAFKMGGYCQPGFLDVGEVVQALTRTVEAVFPAGRQRDELRCVSEMVEGGARQPLDLSHIGRKSPARLTVVRNDEPPEDDDGPQTDGALAVKAKPKGKGPAFEGVRDDGTVPTTLGNVRALLEYYGVTLRLNVMTQETELELPASIIGQAEMRQTTKLGQLRSLARKHRMQVGDALKDELQAVEDLNAYHPVADWIRSKPWDGVDRFEALWSTFVLKEEAQVNADLYRHILWAWLVAGANYAMLEPFERVGIKAFGVLVLQGTQGCGKTQWIKALAPEDKTWVGTGLTLDPHAKDDVAKVTRYWITELGEIDSTVRKADVGALKGFLSDQADVYRRPYKEVTESFVRRTLFAASVNPQHFLRDNTGNRRFWVVPVERMKVWDDDGIRAIDLQQLWAQFAQLAAEGAAHHLPPDIEARQMALAEQHRTIDPIEDEVRAKVVVDVTLPERLWMSTEEIYREMHPDRDLEKWTQADKRAVGMVLSAMGARNGRSKRARLWSVKRVTW